MYVPRLLWPKRQHVTAVRALTASTALSLLFLSCAGCDLNSCPGPHPRPVRRSKQKRKRERGKKRKTKKDGCRSSLARRASIWHLTCWKTVPVCQRGSHLPRRRRPLDVNRHPRPALLSLRTPTHTQPCHTYSHEYTRVYWMTRLTHTSKSSFISYALYHLFQATAALLHTCLETFQGVALAPLFSCKGGGTAPYCIC